MFNNTATEKERSKKYEKYLVNLMRKQKNIKRVKKTLDNKGLGLTENPYIEKENRTFDSLKDYLVVKGFITEQLTQGLKMNKKTIEKWISSLSSPDVYLLSNHLMEFQKDIKAKNININDYILKTSFDEYKKQKLIDDQKKRDALLIAQSQQSNSNALSIVQTSPSTNPTPSPPTPPTPPPAINAPPGPTPPQTISDDAYYASIYGEIQKKYDKKEVLDKRLITDEIERIFLDKTTKRPRFVNISTVKKRLTKEGLTFNEAVQDLLLDQGITGSGIKGGSARAQYKPIGDYLINEKALYGGKIMVRTKNNNQLHRFKTQKSTPNINNIIQKLMNNENINFKDVDVLNENERNILYEFGNTLHIQQLLEIPSSIKTQQQQINDEFEKLRGIIVAGNDSPELIKKFKLLLLKLKNKKMISNNEYVDIVELLFTLGY